MAPSYTSLLGTNFRPQSLGTVGTEERWAHRNSKNSRKRGHRGTVGTEEKRAQRNRGHRGTEGTEKQRAQRNSRNSRNRET